MEINLLKEQKEAFEKVKSSIKNSKQRAPIFIYGKKGIGKTKIFENLKSVLENVEIISVEEKMNELLYNQMDHEEKFEDIIINNFLLKYSPETFLEALLNEFSKRELIIMDQIENIVTSRIDEKLMVSMDFDFGLNSDIAMNGKIVWVFPEDAFLRFFNYWKQAKSKLIDCESIKVFSPSISSLREYFNNNRISDEYEINEEEIEKCLNNKFYHTLKRRYKRKLR